MSKSNREGRRKWFPGQKSETETELQQVVAPASAKAEAGAGSADKPAATIPAVPTVSEAKAPDGNSATAEAGVGATAPIVTEAKADPIIESTPAPAKVLDAPASSAKAEAGVGPMETPAPMVQAIPIPAILAPATPAPVIPAPVAPAAYFVSTPAPSAHASATATTNVIQQPSRLGTVLVAVILTLATVALLAGLGYYLYTLGQANSATPIRPAPAQTQPAPVAPPSTPPALTTPAPGATNLAPAQSDGPKSCVALQTNVGVPVVFTPYTKGVNGQRLYVDNSQIGSRQACVPRSVLESRLADGIDICPLPPTGTVDCWRVPPMHMQKLLDGVHPSIRLAVS